MTKYYFAARYSRHQEMRDYRVELEDNVHDAQVTSTWIDLHGGRLTTSVPPGHLNESPEEFSYYGSIDLLDIDRTDALVAFSSDGGKGGRHVEFGYALGKGKRVVLIGPREHIFHTLPEVEQFNTWEEFLKAEAAR